MTKHLDRPYARYDAQFWQDDRYVAMPKASRNNAYLYMLALVGYCRAKRARGWVPVGMAGAIARYMELPAERTQGLLEEVGLLVRDGDYFQIPKYDKWQDTPDEIADLSAKRAEAASKGGSKTQANRAANEAAKRTERESKSREREVERDLPQVLALTATPSELPEVVVYASLWEELSGKALSATDLEFVRRIPYTCDRLAPAEVERELRQTAGKFLESGKAPPRITYLAGRLQDLQIKASDEGRRPHAPTAASVAGKALP